MIPTIRRASNSLEVSGKKNSYTGGRDTRLDDFLDDKIQTKADLNAVETLLSFMESQRESLQQQLTAAQIKLDEVRELDANHIQTTLTLTEEFRKQQEVLDKRLSIITASEIPDEAVNRFKAPTEKLRRLELASAYIELLEGVNHLASEARIPLPDNPSDALVPYSKLLHLRASLDTLQQSSEGAGVHLLNYVHRRTNSLWEEMKQVMLDDFNNVLKRVKWPTTDRLDSNDFNESFGKLLDLQTPELLAAKDPLILLPMAALTTVFVQEFRYHFMGSKATNVKDDFHEPSAWIIHLIEQWNAWLYDNISPILLRHFQDSNIAQNPAYTNPLNAFVASLLPVVREKARNVLSISANEPGQLSRTVKSILNFDEKLRRQLNSSGENIGDGWEGIAPEFLKVYFDRWLKTEKDHALKRYDDIIRNQNSGKIDFDSLSPEKSKPTYGAVEVVNLLNVTSKQYSSLKDLSLRLRFLIDIQLTILDKYYNRLKDSLDAYIGLTSTVGRTLHGVSKEQQAALEGTGALESLCKVYGSAEYIIEVLVEWSNDSFYVDLWEELQRRARGADTDDNLSGSKSYSDVKRSTSSSMGSDEDGCLFDETIMSLQKLQRQAERLLKESLQSSLQSILRPYANKAQWQTVLATDDQVPHPSLLTVTAELVPPLEVVREDLKFLVNALASPAFRIFWKDTQRILQDFFWQDILLRWRFTTYGAAQLQRDLSSLWAIFEDYPIEGSPPSPAGMPKLKEGIRVLNLPVKGTPNSISLHEVVDVLNSSSTDTAEIDRTVASLDCPSLSLNEIRRILAQRIEGDNGD